MTLIPQKYHITLGFQETQSSASFQSFDRLDKLTQDNIQR